MTRGLDWFKIVQVKEIQMYQLSSIDLVQYFYAVPAVMFLVVARRIYNVYKGRY